MHPEPAPDGFIPSYAQLSQRSYTILFTTYCGVDERRIQILGRPPGMSTVNLLCTQTFWTGKKIPRQIKMIARCDAQGMIRKTARCGLAAKNAVATPMRASCIGAVECVHARRTAQTLPIFCAGAASGRRISGAAAYCLPPTRITARAWLPARRVRRAAGSSRTVRARRAWRHPRSRSARAAPWRAAPSARPD